MLWLKRKYGTNRRFEVVRKIASDGVLRHVVVRDNLDGKEFVIAI